jgi:hypothetical protein
MEYAYLLLISLAVLCAARMLPGDIRRVIGPHQFFAAVTLPAVGFFGFYYAVFGLFTAGLILLAPALTMRGMVLADRQALMLRANLFMFCLPLMPMLTYTVAISGLTILQFTFVNLLSIGFILSMLLSGVRLRTPGLAFWDLAFVAMLAMQIFMDARGHQLTYGLRACVIVPLNLGIPYFAISRACYRSEPPNRIMLACIVAGCILSAVAAFEAIRHWLLYYRMPAFIHADPEMISGYAKERNGLLRARATWPESTGLSLFLGLQLTMLVALRRQVGSRIAFFGLVAMLLMGIVFTFARVGYIMVGVGLVACFLYERRWMHLLGLAVLGPVVVATVVALSHFSPQLAASIGTGGDAGGTVGYRSQLLSAGLALFRQHWLTGMDMDAIYSALFFLRQGEGIIDLVNQPLTIFMRGGLFGGLIYYAILPCILVALFVRSPRLPAESRAAGGACFAGLLGLVASLTTTSYGRNEISYVVLLALAAGVLSRTPVRSRRRPAVRFGGAPVTA